MSRVIFILLVVFYSSSQAATRWFWQDNFSNSEQQMLKSWITQADRGVRVLFGPLPYSYDVYFYRQNGREPVPWAHTAKGGTKSVHFYVNTSYSKQQFAKDWVASHELTHLLFPYIGSSSAWFSEGLASYLQYQVLYANDLISWQQGVNKLKERYNRARGFRTFDRMSILELSRVFRQTGGYVRLYWGGAAYFNHVDQRLYQEKNMRLNDVIRDYLVCCSTRRIRGANNMIRLFDQISNSNIFSKTVTSTVNQKGFPETRNAANWLSNNPPTLLN